MGLMTVPQSCTTQYRSTAISAVSGSVSTTAAWAPLANVDRIGEYQPTASGPGGSPSGTGGPSPAGVANWVARRASSSNAYRSGFASTASVARAIRGPSSANPRTITSPSTMDSSDSSAESAVA